jgi:YesN/AraC family two-component response regulator
MDQNMLEKLAKYKVLYVEDEEGVRKNLSEILSLVFENVLVAKDGKEAYELFELHNLDLIITDIKMPELTGIELVKKIREKNSEVQIIIISAYTEVEYMLEAIELSLVRYIIKPVTETKLLSALEKFLASCEDDKKTEIQDGWIYDSLEKTITSNTNQVYDLTKKEAKLLDMLLKKKNVLSYEEIEMTLWDDEYMSLNALRLMIKNFRKKLPANALKNIQGYGYKL